MTKVAVVPAVGSGERRVTPKVFDDVGYRPMPERAPGGIHVSGADSIAVMIARDRAGEAKPVPVRRG